MNMHLNIFKAHIFSLGLILSAMMPNDGLAQIPAGFEFTGTPLSGTLYGQAQINNLPASGDDWVAAFDEDDNCAGSAQIIEYGGNAYINLTIYGDDATSADEDEGMNNGEMFYLRLYDASEGTYLEYSSPLNVIPFEGWHSNNGAPLIGYDDSNTLYNWLTIDLTFDLLTTDICTAAEPIVLDDFTYPTGGVYEGPGIVDGTFDPSVAGVGTHLLTYEYSLSVLEYEISVYEFGISATVVDPLCNGDNNGSFEVVNGGGFEPLSIDSFGEHLENLSAGDYNVTATDDLGCIASTSATLVENDVLVQLVSSTDVLCNGDATGTSATVASGGTGEYSYDWGEGVDPDALVAGDYSVTTTDTNGCSTVEAFTINEPEVLSFETVVEEVNCAGETSGTISIEITGGYGDYTTDWGDEDPDAVATGEYTVSVTDGNGCTSSQVISVDEPLALTSQVNVSHVLCNGGSDGTAEVEVNGGTGEYSIDWGDADPSALAAGSYSVSIADDNGCSTSSDFEITEPAALESTHSVTDILCYGDATGSVVVEYSGGTGELVIEYMDFDPAAIVAGGYQYSVTDEHGCVLTQSFDVAENDELVMNYSSEAVVCYGESNGSVSINISGGVEPYESVWVGGVDSDNLAAGNHYVEISDAVGCSTLFTVTVDQTEPLSALVVAENATCISGLGSISYSVSGGSNSYIANWGGLDLQNTPVGSHNYHISDSNGCEVSGTTTVYPPTGVCGCTIPEASNYLPNATEYDGLCEFDNVMSDCPADMNLDGVIGLQDLLILLAGYGSYCE